MAGNFKLHVPVNFKLDFGPGLGLGLGVEAEMGSLCMHAAGPHDSSNFILNLKLAAYSRTHCQCRRQCRRGTTASGSGSLLESESPSCQCTYYHNLLLCLLKPNLSNSLLSSWIKLALRLPFSSCACNASLLIVTELPMPPLPDMNQTPLRFLVRFSKSTPQKCWFALPVVVGARP